MSASSNSSKSDNLPSKLGAPAIRALNNHKIYNITQLTKFAEEEIASLHGIGPNAINKLRTSLENKNLSFKKN